MAQAAQGPRKYWGHYTDGSGSWRRSDHRPAGEHLAAMRAGADREPGTVPAMWERHTEFPDEDWRARHHDTWEMPSRFTAEHHALVLFGFHQQSVSEPMHRADVSLGTALRRLRQSGRASETGVDRQLTAAATATSLTELAQHLRRLVTQLRQPRIPLDYDQLLDDLTRWQQPAWQGRVRRRWGLDYYAGRAGQHQEEHEDSAQPSSDSASAPTP